MLREGPLSMFVGIGVQINQLFTAQHNQSSRPDRTPPTPISPHQIRHHLNLCESNHHPVSPPSQLTAKDLSRQQSQKNSRREPKG